MVKAPLRFEAPDGSEAETFLLDVILDRLKKIKTERAYCFRYLYGIIDFRTITATLDIAVNDNDDPTLRSLGQIDLSEDGYPAQDQDFLSKHEKFSGVHVKQLLDFGDIS